MIRIAHLTLPLLFPVVTGGVHLPSRGISYRFICTPRHVVNSTDYNSCRQIFSFFLKIYSIRLQNRLSVHLILRLSLQV
jgi:hypothetical protein